MHCFQGVWCYGHNGIYSKQEYDAIFIYWADESLGNMIDVYVKGITDKETYLMRKESYEVMISGIKEKIAAQKEAVYVLENQRPYDNRHSMGIPLWFCSSFNRNVTVEWIKLETK